jgi:MFS transporter, DHA1 family, tetracycline resistance protein
MQKRQAGLGFIFFTLFLDILGLGLVIPVLPKLIEQFTGGNTSDASFYSGVLIAVYALMQFIFAPVLGSLSDQFGRRPIILLSLLGLGLDYIILAVAPNLAWFFVGRVIAGITSASISAGTAYIADISPPEKRAQNFGLLGAAFGLGFIAGPALGGLLGGTDLRLPFWVAAGLTLLNVLYGFFILPESLKPENRRPFDWGRANPIGSLAALGKYPVVLSLAASIVLSSLAQNALQSTWVLYTGYKFNWDTRAVGVSLAIVGITTAIMQGGVIRILLPKLGEQRAILIGQISSIISFTLYGLATQGWMMYAIIAVGAIGSVGGPALQGLISRGVPANEQGAVQGSLSSLTSLTGVVGPLIANTAFGYFISDTAPVKIPGIAFFIGAGFIAVSLVLIVRAFRHIDFAPSPTTREV